jgi:hypothetical protein
MASLLFHMYGYPPAKEVSVFPVDDTTEITQINDLKIKNATVLDSFHDVVIHAIGYTIKEKKRTNRSRYYLKVKVAFTIFIVRHDDIAPGIRLIQPIKFKIYSISYCMDYYVMKTVQNSCIFYFEVVYLS